MLHQNQPNESHLELALSSFIAKYKQLAREGMVCDEDLYCSLIKLEAVTKKAPRYGKPFVTVKEIVSL